MKKLFDKKSNIDRKKLKKNGFSKKKVAIGPFLTATFTAILIGLFFGLMMLNMFSEKEKNVSTDDNQTDTVSENLDDTGQTEEDTLITLDQMGAYVIQLGVFSEQKNAVDWAKRYEQIGFPSTYFQRDNQYYLFSGMAETEEKAKEFADLLLKEDIEVYVKEWVTNEIEIELTAEEDKWLTLFHKQWEKTLQSLENEEKISLTGWSELIESHPFNSEEFADLIEAIQLLPENEVENNFELQNQLLNIWKVYEEIF